MTVTVSVAAVAALKAEIARAELELKSALASGNAPLVAACESIIDRLTRWQIEHDRYWATKSGLGR